MSAAARVPIGDPLQAQDGSVLHRRQPRDSPGAVSPSTTTQLPGGEPLGRIGQGHHPKVPLESADAHHRATARARLVGDDVELQMPAVVVLR